MLHKKKSDRTKESILFAASEQFAKKGLYGARVDEIAEAAKANKRMIYAYFTNKEGLYKAVLLDAYQKLQKMELSIIDMNMDCIEAIKRIIHEYYMFLHHNPDFVSLMMWENLNHAQYMKDFDPKQIKDPVINLIKQLVRKGKNQGVFKENVDEMQVIMSLIMFSFSYFSNQYTLSAIFDINMKSDDIIEE